MSDSPRTVSVDIRGQQYSIRSGLDERYVLELARYVDEKIRKAADAAPAADAARLAVLAALNIADEYFQCQEGRQAGQDTLAARTERLEHFIDEAIKKVGR